MTTKRPLPKKFDISNYEKILLNLEENMAELKFEKKSEVLVPYILENYEGFEKIEKGPNFRGTPFDSFGFKSTSP